MNRESSVNTRVGAITDTLNLCFEQLAGKILITKRLAPMARGWTMLPWSPQFSAFLSREARLDVTWGLWISLSRQENCLILNLNLGHNVGFGGSGLVCRPFIKEALACRTPGAARSHWRRLRAETMVGGINPWRSVKRSRRDCLVCTGDSGLWHPKLDRRGSQAAERRRQRWLALV